MRIGASNRAVDLGPALGNGPYSHYYVEDSRVNSCSYDLAGNLTTDTFSGAAVSRIYDAKPSYWGDSDKQLSGW
jgi:hypothetical protein